MKSKLFTIARFLFFLGIGIFFIWLFLHKLDSTQKNEILVSFTKANYWWIAFAIMLGILSHYVRAIRWKMLIEPLGYYPSNLNTFFAVMIGYISNLALPRLGEVSRCTVLNRYAGVPFQKSFGTVITERAIDMILFLVLFFLNLVLQYDRLYGYIEQKIYKPLESKFNYTVDFSGYITKIAIATLILFTVLLIAFRKPLLRSNFVQKIWGMAKGFLEGMKSFAQLKKPWRFIFFSVLIWVLYLLMAYLVFFSLPDTSRLGLDAGLAILVFGSIGIMIVQGGIGIYPAIVAETLIIYNIQDVTGYALGWLIWTSQNITIVAVGLLSMILLPILNPSKQHAKA